MASELLNLEADLPTTPEDVRALRAAREGTAMSVAQIAEASMQLDDLAESARWARSGPRGEPFTLPDGSRIDAAGGAENAHGGEGGGHA